MADKIDALFDDLQSRGFAQDKRGFQKLYACSRHARLSEQKRLL